MCKTIVDKGSLYNSIIVYVSLVGVVYIGGRLGAKEMEVVLI